MKLFEIIASITLLAFSSGIFVSAAEPVERLSKKLSERRALYQQNNFIFSSFEELCRNPDSTVEDFDKWKKTVSAMFGIEKIQVEKFCGEQALLCRWKVNEVEKEIVFRREK